MSTLPVIIIIIFLILPILAFIFSQLTSKPHHKHQHQHQHHGFKSYPIIGCLPEFIVNRHRFFDWTTDVLQSQPTHTAILFRPGRVHGVLTAFPGNVEHILKTRFDNYPKGSRIATLLQDFLGSGIFNSDGQLWRVQRKTAAFTFTRRNLNTFILDAVRTEIFTRLLPLLREAAHSGRVLDLQDVLERFAFDNVCKLAFNVDPGCLAGDGSGKSDFMRAFDEATTLSAGRFRYAVPYIWKVKKLFNLGSEKTLGESIRIVHDFADYIIRSRLEDESGENYQDLLSHFISSPAGKNDRNFLRDVVVNVILAGRDTTSSGLSWFFWLLSLNPNVYSSIQSEVARVRKRAGKRVGDTFDSDELKEMHYLHGAISESLRLYPPVPVDTMICLNDDVLPDGTEIKKDWFISYHAFAMGRMESIWGKDCLEYRPERWLDENGQYKPDSPFRFPVFHAGPRSCLGKEMAYIQMKSIVACVVEEFDVDVLGKESRPEPLLSLTLRVKGGLHVKIKPRNAKVD